MMKFVIPGINIDEMFFFIFVYVRGLGRTLVNQLFYDSLLNFLIYSEYEQGMLYDEVLTWISNYQLSFSHRYVDIQI